MPEIETDRLLLRMFTPKDGAAMYDRIWTDEEVMRYVQPGGWPHAREESSALVQQLIDRFSERGFGQWAIVPKRAGELIGYCGLRYVNKTTDVELLYGIVARYWGRGFATEAARASLRFGFEEARLERIVALALPGNAASRRVMEKLGMKLEGPARHHDFDVVRYSIARDEFDYGDGLYLLRH